ncbi:MAG: ribonuclease HII [Elusimicrobiaceae bacterium]|nr:ribonuclease HII [Elusimicrobiaceae bacterium]
MALIDFDLKFQQKYPSAKLVGVDEAGRGPLAGPVCAAACYIEPSLYTHPLMQQINDSKKLTPQKREAIFKELITLPIIYCTGFASSEQIDKINILQATFLAMRHALTKFNKQNIYVLVDGNRLISNLKAPQEAIIKGDGTSLCIAAASIIAKVSRDRYMDIASQQYPVYNFAEHKGYGTQSHIEAIKKYGPCKEHRTTFEPIASLYGGLFGADFN